MNYVYWQGKIVGYEMDGLMVWFPSAPREAINAGK